MAPRSSRPPSSAPGFDTWILMGDLLLLASIPLVLGAVQLFGPESLHALFSFNSEQTTLHGLFAHWTVHYSSGLLLENLLGYAVIAVLGYGLASLSDERRWFRFSFATIFLVVPAISTVVSSAAFTALEPGFSYTSRGVSAAIAGLLGLFYVLYLGVLRRTFDQRATISAGGAVLILALTGLLSTIGSPSLLTIGTLAGAALAIVALDGIARLLQRSVQIPWSGLLVGSLLGIAVTAVLLGFFVALFPADPFAGATVTNVFSHASGFGLGALIAFWGHRYWTQWSWL